MIANTVMAQSVQLCTVFPAGPTFSTPMLPGPGTLTSVFVNKPALLGDCGGVDASFYDTAVGSTAGGPIALVQTGDNGNTALSVSFSKGLFIVQRSRSGLSIVFG